jgi:hypothetical protein
MIGVIEGLQFVAGMFDAGQIERVAPRAELSLFTGQSAYGPRVGQQLRLVVDELMKDMDSRRAVIIISRPDEPLEDRPCTVSMQFQTTRPGDLLTTVTMRSSDAVWGLPYDLIQFAFMSFAVSSCLGITNGMMMINIGNAHVYNKTAHLARAYKRWGFFNGLKPLVSGVSDPMDRLAIIKGYCEQQQAIMTLDDFCQSPWEFKERDNES